MRENYKMKEKVIGQPRCTKSQFSTDFKKMIPLTSTPQIKISRTENTFITVCSAFLIISLVAGSIAAIFHVYIEDTGNRTTSRVAGSRQLLIPSLNEPHVAEKIKQMMAPSTFGNNQNTINRRSTSHLLISKTNRIKDKTTSIAKAMTNATTTPASTTTEEIRHTWNPLHNDNQLWLAEGKVADAPLLVNRLNKKPVTLFCHLTNMNMWNSVILVRLLSKGLNKTIVQAFSNGVWKVEDDTLSPRVSVHFRVMKKIRLLDDVAVLSVMYDPLECDDAGTYACFVNSPVHHNPIFGKVSITVRSTHPVIETPIEIIEDKVTRLSCMAVTEYPEQKLYWRVKWSGRKSFVSFLPPRNTVNRAVGNCSVNVTISFPFKPRRPWNGTIVQCVSQIPNEFSGTKLLTETTEIQVVPENYCSGRSEGTFLSHPYTCTKFVRCLSTGFKVKQCPFDLCFNLQKGTCDFPASSL